MPYDTTTFGQQALFVNGRWVDASALFQWVMDAVSTNVAVVNEKQRLRELLTDTYVKMSSKERFPDKVVYVDSTATVYREPLADAFAFLGSRATDKGASTDASGTSVAQPRGIPSDQLRKWQANLTTLQKALLDQKALVDRAAFEKLSKWTGQ
jgi:hypothetical protein